MEWLGTIAAIIATILWLLTKKNKHSQGVKSEQLESLVGVLVSSIGESKETIRAAEVVDKIKELRDDEKKEVTALSEDDFAGLDLDAIDVAKVVHKKVTSEDGKTVEGELLDSIIESVEKSTETKEKANKAIRAIGKVFKIAKFFV